MPATASITFMLVTGLLFSLAACVPPTPKVQRPAAAPQTIEQRPQSPVRDMDRSSRPMVREGSATTSLRHG